MTRYKPSGATRFFIIFMALGLLLVLFTSLAQRFSHPALTFHMLDNSPGQSRQTPEMPGNMETIGRLMQEVAANPQDKDKTINLAEALMQAGQWQVAENFAQKALALSGTDDSRPLYLLAIIHHNKGEHAQAAELLEKTLEKSENPSARYSLGILYLHYLKKPEEGMKELRKGLAIPNIPNSLRSAMQEELDKGSRPQTPPGNSEKPASMQ